MSLVWKTIAVLAALLAVSSAIHHRHHKSHFTHGGDDAVLLSQKQKFNAEDNGDLTETIIHGKILCDERALEGARPYLSSPEYPKIIINICATNEGGWYRLTTGTHFEFHEKIYLTVRHQCPMDGLAPMKKCAVPYYTTMVKLDVNNTTYIHNDLELSKMKAFSSADCLY